MVLFKSVAALALALASSQVWAAEVAPNEELGRTMYDTGIVHEQIMAKKMVCPYFSFSEICKRNYMYRY